MVSCDVRDANRKHRPKITDLYQYSDIFHDNYVFSLDDCSIYVDSRNRRSLNALLEQNFCEGLAVYEHNL